LRGGVAIERDVDAVSFQALIELLRGELAGARVDRSLERLARLVGGLAGRGPLIGRQLGDVPQEVRQLGLAPEVLDADVLERVGVAGGGDRLLGLRTDVRDPVVHSGAILRLNSYKATVAAIAAFRLSVRIGM